MVASIPLKYDIGIAFWVSFSEPVLNRLASDKGGKLASLFYRGCAML